MNKQVVKFFKDKTDTDPDDSYGMETRNDTGVGWMIYNWLQMYPQGKVEFTSWEE
jgi:hypothetical protein